MTFSLSAAFRADAFDHVVNGMRLESIRNIDHGHSCRFNAICFLAMLAIEMGMLVGNAVLASTQTQLVFQ